MTFKNISRQTTRKFLLFLIFNATNTFSQVPYFFDSTDFFVRNNIREIFIKDFRNDSTIWEGKMKFSKKKQTTLFCGKYDKKVGLHGNRVGKWDCDPEVSLITTFKDNTIDEGSSTKFLFFNNNRLDSIFDDYSKTGGPTQITKYFYTDSVAKRLKMIVYKSSYGHGDTTTFYYEKNRLHLTIKTEYNTRPKEEKRLEVKQYYEYYPNGRLKKTCLNDTNCVEGSEFTYKLGK